jgi:hypothetical protein
MALERHYAEIKALAGAFTADTMREAAGTKK